VKLLINTSNLYVGGGMQVALSFINELKEIKTDNEYHIFLSSAIQKQINQETFSEQFYFYNIQKSPAPLKNRKEIINMLNKLEEKIQPDIVFSVFGPTFWRPQSLHIMGFALPWLINPDSAAFGELKFLQRIKKRLEILYKAYFVKHNADYYITETEDTKLRFHKYHNIKKEKIYVVGNTYNSYFDNPILDNINLMQKEKNEFRLITISHNYPHKNLKIIREVIPYLKKQDIKYKFVLTISKEEYKKLFLGFEEYVTTLEALPVHLCPSAYAQTDALFLPTLLECFTASYPEAMKMEKPILTSNLSFAKDICKDSALYFDPLNPKDIAAKIIALSKNQEVQQKLVQKGKERLKTFETARTRAENYLNICDNIIKDGKAKQ